MQDELNVVWITTPLLEEDWFRHLLSNFAANHVFDAHLRQPQPNSLYVVNSNILPLARIDPSFLRAVRHTPNVGLLHASDESFSQDYRYVRKFFVHHPHASRKIAQCAESCLDRPLRMAKRYSSGVSLSTRLNTPIPVVFCRAYWRFTLGDGPIAGWPRAACLFGISGASQRQPSFGSV
jgi:hypothetical protein